MTTLSVSPAYPVPGRECSLTFVVSGGANFAKIWIVKAPQGSKLRTKIDSSVESRLPFQFGAVSTPIQFTPDVGGIYTFVVQGYVKGASSYGGSYENDPSGNETETPIGAESNLTVQVGQRVTQKVGKSPDSATLTLWIFGSTIRGTTLAVHGEASPSLSKPASTKAGIAVESTAVQDALLPLVDADVATALGDLGTIVLNLGTIINGHLANGSVHNAADAVNVIPVGLTSSVSPNDLPKVMSSIFGSLKRHFQNDDGGKTTGVVPGPDSADYHQLAGILKEDTIDLPIFDSVGDLETAYAGIADVWRSYEAHRQNLGVHLLVDSTNVLSPLPAVLQLHQLFISVLASIAPVVPPTINSGVVTAVSTAGFKET